MHYLMGYNDIIYYQSIWENTLWVSFRNDGSQNGFHVIGEDSNNNFIGEVA